MNTLVLDSTRTDQTILGFGCCMSELGHDALALLSPADRATVLDTLFTPGRGANFTVVRTPVGASDFARDFYSYNEVPGDFAMEHFSLERDETGLLPLLRAVKARVPEDELLVWASPWCPPRWLKRTGKYSSAPMGGDAGSNDFSGPADRVREGEDGFLADPAHFAAYALYFRRYVESMRAAGIPVWAVMPQNEPNSDQCFPSCTWKAETLAEFIGKYLGPALEGTGVQLFLGTIERPSLDYAETILRDPECARYVRGVGFQWAGKDALPGVRAAHPDLLLIQSEQECGDGRNDLAHAWHTWDLMRHYLGNGVSVYEYWNIALVDDAISSWGWKQNSLVTVDPVARTFRFNPEYTFLATLSANVRRGAKRWMVSGFDDALAFQNPDGGVVVVAANRTDAPVPLAVEVDGVRRAEVNLAPQGLTATTVRA
ncbi:MAG: glycoside hydrolase family 30 protein [Kiritimatiellia bacterium]|jgi:glucosylceramidase